MKTILWATLGVLVCTAAILGILWILDIISQADALDYGGKIGSVVFIVAIASAAIVWMSRRNQQPTA
ncbi:MAG: hypothetical protein A2W52_02945 [Candidatus Taylorbacteria bacterium RIFCSPHIGHO2_02_49_25]|uniref:Uncharacterized protein n=1 Tax=Candidatus Taylorbacteria bacterium RIFCSPHIGHO2_02_49_25 TaxID=1802305 RepID=A0A1G2MHV8_9BACT|nr:MAG: hypothetical protein UY62_C0013G0005 [Parcubacteria group bacterium GW2011_GWF2_50_9]OHA19104.1 MAG: hypothetical protein A2759_00830 [Candidatus Taylorbacteria bacterium RIFCSPHIGHO2_01_FULL_49_60]OHA22759.1 MAG: hypothetical protein A2W52_02945 [Candidatus Taylorbacteria bacterium RIFCSPHIGHO2_02_49_25]OHA35530.1 MAG: hypothetical protein A2W65_00520 [Candidatus Taylorbacteria bacterium RIFCSPLOWO2_02_50_13]OHA43019.1 MAG: hypothetical protein A3H73_03220 [Candidatus Taylorbacteria ba